MTTSTETWKALPLPWQVAFEEAWASFRAGNFGVGAVLTEAPDHPDAVDGIGPIVAAGRNRVAQTQRAPRTLSGNLGKGTGIVQPVYSLYFAFFIAERFSAIYSGFPS